MVKFILIKSPDEWATTKQACRDELVVYVFFSSVYISLYFYVLSTVLRKSSFTLYIYTYIYIIVMENEDGQLRAKENIYSKNSKNDKKFNKKRFGL